MPAMLCYCATSHWNPLIAQEMTSNVSGLLLDVFEEMLVLLFVCFFFVVVFYFDLLCVFNNRAESDSVLISYGLGFGLSSMSDFPLL